jgi:hypothetical protein
VFLLEIFNFWTVIIVAIICHYYLEIRKFEKEPQKIKELEERIEKLEKKPE